MFFFLKHQNIFFFPSVACWHHEKVNKEILVILLLLCRRTSGCKRSLAVPGFISLPLSSWRHLREAAPFARLSGYVCFSLPSSRTAAPRRGPVQAAGASGSDGMLTPCSHPHCCKDYIGCLFRKCALSNQKKKMLEMCKSGQTSIPTEGCGLRGSVPSLLSFGLREWGTWWGLAWLASTRRIQALVWLQLGLPGAATY